MTMSRGKDHPDTDPYKKMYEESARDVRDLEKQKTVVCCTLKWSKILYPLSVDEKHHVA